MSEKQVKVGVLGAGHLGKIHIQQWKNIPHAELVGFYDADVENCKKVTEEYGIPSFHSAEELMDASQAVDIVTPTTTHFQYAQKAIKKGKHVFIEKPITETEREAKQLVELVKEAGVKCQVGHVERFNPAFLAVKHLKMEPQFIEVHRLAPFNPRGTDVSVVLDLMIHDIDIILSIVKSPVKRVSASGVGIIKKTPDIANARIEFGNGCVANLTASRISMKKMRKMRVFQQNQYLTIDFLDKKAEAYKILEHYTAEDAGIEFEMDGGEKRKLQYDLPDIEHTNAIQMELDYFAKAILEDKEPPITAMDGLKALEVAYQIMKKM